MSKTGVNALHRNDWWNDGYYARIDGFGREACPYGADQAVSKGWWMAGWHDMDREMTVWEHHCLGGQ